MLWCANGELCNNRSLYCQYMCHCIVYHMNKHMYKDTTCGSHSMLVARAHAERSHLVRIFSLDYNIG